MNRNGWRYPGKYMHRLNCRRKIALGKYHSSSVPSRLPAAGSVPFYLLAPSGWPRRSRSGQKVASASLQASSVARSKLQSQNWNELIINLLGIPTHAESPSGISPERMLSKSLLWEASHEIFGARKEKVDEDFGIKRR